MERSMTFTIYGNQKKETGNPIGYKRMLGNKMRKDSREYLEFRELVQKAYLARYTKDELNYEESIKLLRNPKLAAKLRPIYMRPGERARMELMIYWCDETHGDPDNIFKGIADALFTDDKHVAGSFDYEHAKAGKVEVKITIT